jgi:hypothetical protein
MVIVAIACACGARRASAQPAPVFSLDPLNVGDCRVVVKITNPRGGDRVGIIVDQTLIREQTVAAGGGTLTFGLADPLRAGSVVRVRVNGSENVNTGAIAGLMVKVVDKPGSRTSGQCEPEAGQDDESPFFASFFLGEVVDNFAPDKVGNYRNPEQASNAKGGFIFGFDFDYRVHGRSDSRVQWWIEGETMHGVRTADVNCKPADPAEIPPVCNATPANVSDRARYILKNASSLEVWASPRVEFHTLQGGTDSPAKLYAGLNLGFIALDDAPFVYRTHHVGLGLAADAGAFAGSFLEVGWGKNELFSTEWNRLKISGLLSFSIDRLPLWRDTGRLFVEMTIDNSLDSGPDSVRTFFGVDVDLRRVSQ